ELDLGVDARPDTPVELHDEALADHVGGVRLVEPDRPFLRPCRERHARVTELPQPSFEVRPRTQEGRGGGALAPDVEVGPVYAQDREGCLATQVEPAALLDPPDRPRLAAE